MKNPPRTVQDVATNFAEQARVDALKEKGLTDGEAQYAALLVMPSTEVAPEPAMRLAELKRMGLTDGTADFAARLKMPGT